MSIHYLIREGRDKTATDALQLSSLLIEPGQRLRLHRLLRFIHKTGRNSQLQLSQRIPNKEFVSTKYMQCNTCTVYMYVTAYCNLGNFSIVEYFGM